MKTSLKIMIITGFKAFLREMQNLIRTLNKSNQQTIVMEDSF